MSEERIQFDLIERFTAPLPEFYQRRIIFWQDEDREFESMLDELYIPDVTILKLTGTNNFAVKKLLLHDDLTGNYLIYNSFSYADPKDNWLLDIEKFSEEYRSDLISTRMNELNIEASPAMRKTVKLYAKFFDSKERIERLKRIGREYHTPLQLHIDIMAVLAGLNGGSRRMYLLLSFLQDRMRKTMPSSAISRSSVTLTPSGSLSASTRAISMRTEKRLTCSPLMCC